MKTTDLTQKSLSKEEKIASFDPNSPANLENNIYGLPFTLAEARTVIIPVPWEVTTSYRAGTAAGPEAVFNASFQVDLFDPYVKDAWKKGIAMEPVFDNLAEKNDRLRKMAEVYISFIERGGDVRNDKKMKEVQEQVNSAGNDLNQWVKESALKYLDNNQLVAILGGDHSSPLGLIQALSERYESFGILQIDAHADLRKAYEGFEFSHASIMHNALKLPQISKLVQVGIRDLCEAENEKIIHSRGRIETFFEHHIRQYQYQGQSWGYVVQDIIKELPENIYISFDIDGLDPKLCPNTGTPVPGGMEIEDAIFLIHSLSQTGKKIIGLDLCEVSPGNDEWDANVGARLLYRLCNLMSLSNDGF